MGGDRMQSGKAPARRRVAMPDRCLLSLEPLEDRRMLATFFVSTLGDTFINEDDDVEVFAGSLRAAVNAANANDEADIILFAEGLAGSIALNDGQLAITANESLRILGPSPGVITVIGDSGDRIFFIESQDEEGFTNVEISGLTLTGGGGTGGDDIPDLGGAVFSRENLTMREVILVGNSAPDGGGAIYHQSGQLTISRSLIQGNSSGGFGGGGLLMGVVDDEEEATVENMGRVTIVDSTFTSNSVSGSETFGGAIYNRLGNLLIRQSTIVGNRASNTSDGVASHGNPPPKPPEGGMGMPVDQPRTVETYVLSSILYQNRSNIDDGMAFDISVVGPPEDQGDPPMPVDLLPSVTSLGYNIFGTVEMRVQSELSGEDLPVGTDPLLSTLVFRGGVTNVFYLEDGSPAIDAGSATPDPEIPEEELPSFNFAPTAFEQRGRHFAREFGQQIDIGAVEVQEALFTVDILDDESDSQYSDVSIAADPYTFGNFSLREALLFSDVNPEVDTIDFYSGLSAPGATITVSLGALPVSDSVFVEGPENWLLTLNSLDPTPLVKNSDGDRVFHIDNGNNLLANDIFMSNLIVSGGDFAGNGGGIFTRENLTLTAMTIRNNGTSLRGGAVYVQFADLSIDGTTINNNRAGDDGGGVYIDGADGLPTVLITNSTISGNNAGDRGAGITNNGGHLTVKYTTITNNNSGSTHASGIANFAAASLTEVHSSIISGNVNNDIGFFLSAPATSFQSLGYNIVGKGNPGSVARFTEPGDKPNILNPLLDPLAVTGGRVATHRPKPGSPAIDMGDPAAVAGVGDVPEFDQRGEGFARIFDDGVNPPRIDIGSYELQPALLVVDNPGSTDDGIYTIGNLTLVEAVNIANLNPLPDTIVFNITTLPPSLVGGATPLTITDHLVIDGPGSGILALSPGGLGSIFRLDDSNATLLDVDISGMELRDATAGAIESRENLNLDDIVFVNNESATAGGALFHELGSLTFTNSLVTGNLTTGLDADGGGLYVRDSVVTMDNVTVAGNRISQTNSDGAGIAFINSIVTANLLTVAGNTAPAANSRGGGIFLENSTLTLQEGVVSSNTTAGSGSVGGGIAAINSDVVVGPNSLINVNSTIGSLAPGGGVYISGGSLAIDGAQMAQNFTTGHTSPGGAIAVRDGANVTVNETVISQNFVSGNGSHGGAIANIGGTFVLRDSLVSANEARHATSKGGGVYSDTNLGGLSTLILNSTVSGNSAMLRGGGVFNADGRTDIKHSTITNNSSFSTLNTGSGVASFGNPATTLTTVYSSIIAGNVGVAAGTHTDVDSVEASFINSFQSLGYNLIGTGNSQSAFNQTGDFAGVTNPLLAPLADNTNDPFAATPLLTHDLLPGSFAINGGSPTFNPNSYSPALTSDQRGALRVQAGRIDIGAHESDLSPSNPADFDGDNDVDGSDFLTWQRNLGQTNATPSQGDANGDGVVNGQDLTAWRNNFGAGSSAVAAAVSASSGTLLAAEEVQSAPAAAEEQSASTQIYDYSSLASLGVPGSSAGSAKTAKAVRSEESPEFTVEIDQRDAAFLWSSTGGLSLLETLDDGDLDSLVADSDGADAAAEDEAFAAWGEALHF